MLKKFFLLIAPILLVGLSSQAKDLDLTGKYATLSIAGVYFLDLNSDGTLEMVEVTESDENDNEMAYFFCSGIYTIKEGMLTSQVTCPDGASYIQKVDFNQVDFDKLDEGVIVNAQSSLYGDTFVPVPLLKVNPNFDPTKDKAGLKGIIYQLMALASDIWD